MTPTPLTYDEALLLQRHVDEECSPQEEAAAEALLQHSAAARIYVEALQGLRQVLRLAEEAAWEKAPSKSAEEIVEKARTWAGWAEASLDDLAPLLERFHDGETDIAEAQVIARLIDEREDVAEYLAELERISSGIRHLAEPGEVDFAGLWENIAREIGTDSGAPIPLDPFQPEEHSLLLHRFHDNEVSSEERRRVQNWIEGQEENVDGLLGAMAEIHVGVNAAIELAQEEADLDQIWAGVEERLDAIDAEESADNVVSLSSRSRTASRSPHTQTIIVAAAAVVIVVFAGLFAQQMLSPAQIVETRTVVIFDSVEYAPGSSVMIHNPELASFDGADNENDVPILWVIEDDDDDDEEWDEYPGPI